MSESTEIENIVKLKKLVDKIEATRRKEKALLTEVDGLLRKRYPCTDRSDIHSFRRELDNFGFSDSKLEGINRAKIMLDTKKGIIDSSKAYPVKKDIRVCEICGNEFELHTAHENHRVSGWKLACLSCREAYLKEIERERKENYQEYVTAHPEEFS